MSGRVRLDQAGLDEVDADVRADIEHVGAGAGRHGGGQLLLGLAQRGGKHVQGEARMVLGVGVAAFLVPRAPVPGSRSSN